MNTKKIQWHPGFVAAIDLELSTYRSDLRYEREYNLNTKPLTIDLLVIKKERSIQIENDIGKLFRGHNIMEYKSPDNHLDIDTFYKSGAYASLYKAYGEKVDERKAEDITISILRERRPKGLFRYFEKHGIRMERPYPGIYYILDQVLFPTQIIVLRELEGAEHLWLKALSNRLKKQDLKELFKNSGALTLKYEQGLADAVMQVSLRANQKTVEELKGDEDMWESIREFWEPEYHQHMKKDVEKAVEKAVGEAVEKAVGEAVEKAVGEAVEKAVEENTAKVAAETKEKESIRTASLMLKAGRLSPDEIQEYVPRLSLERILQLRSELAGQE